MHSSNSNSNKATSRREAIMVVGTSNATINVPTTMDAVTMAVVISNRAAITSVISNNATPKAPMLRQEKIHRH